MMKRKYWMTSFSFLSFAGSLLIAPHCAHALDYIEEVATSTTVVSTSTVSKSVAHPKSFSGIASWYAHKRYPNGAATNLFPLGTKLKVTHLATGKQINVTVTSTWTQKNAKRVIDIVSTGFKKLASLSTGLINVRIERL